MTGVIQRHQREITFFSLENVDGAGILPDPPKTLVAQPQHAQQDDAVDDGVADQDDGLPGVAGGQLVHRLHDAGAQGGQRFAAGDNCSVRGVVPGVHDGGPALAGLAGRQPLPLTVVNIGQAGVEVGTLQAEMTRASSVSKKTVYFILPP